MYITVPVIHQIFLHSTTKYSQIHPLKVEESLLLSNEAQWQQISSRMFHYHLLWNSLFLRHGLDLFFGDVEGLNLK